MKIKASAVPADEEWFNLKIDYDSDPMKVVASVGYLNANFWKYLGPELSGKYIIKAKLVYLGYVRNLDEAKQKVKEMGYRLVEGQVKKSFMSRFPESDGKGRVVFGGSEWQCPRGHAHVFYLDRWYNSHPHGSTRAFSSYARWLVAG